MPARHQRRQRCADYGSHLHRHAGNSAPTPRASPGPPTQLPASVDAAGSTPSRHKPTVIVVGALLAPISWRTCRYTTDLIFSTGPRSFSSNACARRRANSCSASREDAGEYPGEADVDRHIQLMQPRGEILIGPGSLAVNEQLRAEAFAAAGTAAHELRPMCSYGRAASHRILQ